MGGDGSLFMSMIDLLFFSSYVLKQEDIFLHRISIFVLMANRGGAEPEYGIRKGTNNVFFTNTYFEQIL